LVCLPPFGEVCLRVSQFSTAFLTSRFSSALYTGCGVELSVAEGWRRGFGDVEMNERK
jgi:hypothetical protein